MRRLLPALVLLVALAVPASSTAAPRASADGVAAHLRTATTLLGSAERQVASGRDVAGVRTLRRARRSAAAASRQARLLAHRAPTAPATSNSLAAVASFQQDLLERAGALLPQLTGAVQQAVAAALPAAAAGQDALLDELLALARAGVDHAAGIADRLLATLPARVAEVAPVAVLPVAIVPVVERALDLARQALEAVRAGVAAALGRATPGAAAAPRS